MKEPLRAFIIIFCSLVVMFFLTINFFQQYQEDPLFQAMHMYVAIVIIGAGTFSFTLSVYTIILESKSKIS